MSKKILFLALALIIGVSLFAGVQFSLAADAQAPLSASCYGEASNNFKPLIDWHSEVSGGSGSYSYSWSINNDVSGYGEGSTQGSSVIANYSSIGTKEAIVRVNDGTGQSTSVTCQAKIQVVIERDFLISDIRLTVGGSILSLFIKNNSLSNYTGDLEYKVEGLDSYSNGIKSVYINLNPAVEKEIFIRDLAFKPLSVGDYNIKITIDPNNKIKETNEENNTLTKTITIDSSSVQSSSGKPDLVIIDITFGKDVESGRENCLIAKVLNAGEGVAKTNSGSGVVVSWSAPENNISLNGVSQAIELSKDQYVLIARCLSPEELKSLGSKASILATVNENSSVQDPKIEESNYNNNTLEKSIAFTTSSAQSSSIKPDLVIKDITFGKDIESGGENCLIAKVVNIGEGIAKTSAESGIVVSWSAPDINISLAGVSQAINLSKDQYVLIARCLGSDELKSLGVKALISASVNKSGDAQDPQIEESNFLNNEYKKEINFTIASSASADQITQINTNANLLTNDKMSEILAELNQLRSIIQEQQTQIKYLSSLLKDVQGISAASQAVLNNFITYGVDANTVKLGAGERAAVINSYKSAFDKLPQTEAELADVIKIANGRWPSITNKDAENQAKAQFLKIYKRAADMNGANDNAAVTIMAYGLRQKAENRNLNSEVNGIKIFKAIYGHTPRTTEEWNAMQAITYSGATQKTWSGYNPTGN